MVPLLTVTILLAILAGILMVKVCLLRKAAREIADQLEERLAEDTNTLIGISTRDKAMRKLASRINDQLRLLRRERRRYQQGDRELKEAVTNISHDLRTPLTAVCGYLALLEKEEKSEAVQRYLGQIENRTAAMKELTEELFRYSVVTSQQSLHPERLDLVRELEESLLSFHSLMCRQGLKPSLTLPEEPVWRQLDRSALARIFSNILSNALKYSDGALAVTMTEAGTITFANPAKDLDPVAVGRLFDRFYTVEASRNATGLGLSIAKALTEQMGGTIGAEYEKGWLRIWVEFHRISQ